MQADRLNRILGALALLYVVYIAVALFLSRLREALRNGRRRDASLGGFRIPSRHPPQAHPYRKGK
jgi:hypothetical protein